MFASGLDDSRCVMDLHLNKPLRFRPFRVLMYASYVIVMVWIALATTLAGYNAVWGPDGEALRAREACAEAHRAAKERAARSELVEPPSCVLVAVE